MDWSKQPIEHSACSNDPTDHSAWHRPCGSVCIMPQSGSVVRTVLVVEDDPTVRFLERFLLEDAGYLVVEANNGDQALALALTAHPDLVVLDVGLPTISGLQVLHTLGEHALTKSIPVLIVSSYAPLIAEEHRARIAGTITKPFEPSEFLTLVGTLVQGGAPTPV
jgi:CheY-like chemotaxis protein